MEVLFDNPAAARVSQRGVVGPDRKRQRDGQRTRGRRQWAGGASNTPARGNSYKGGTAMAQATTKAKAKQPTKAELQQRLTAALARGETAEAVLLARPATATPPPNGHGPEALLAPARG